MMENQQNNTIEGFVEIDGKKVSYSLPASINEDLGYDVEAEIRTAIEVEMKKDIEYENFIAEQLEKTTFDGGSAD